MSSSSRKDMVGWLKETWEKFPIKIVKRSYNRLQDSSFKRTRRLKSPGGYAWAYSPQDRSHNDRLSEYDLFRKWVGINLLVLSTPPLSVRPV